MKLAAICALVLVIAIGATIAYYRFRKSSAEQDGGFEEWVKNPDWRLSAAAEFAARDAVRVPDDISEEDIRAMVERLFEREDRDFNNHKLKLLGPKAVPYLVEALHDPRTSSVVFGEDSSDESPFERICDLLTPFGPAEAVAPLVSFAKHQDERFRKEAVLALGNIGNSDCTETIREALRDEDDYTRSYAMMGIERGISGKRCTKDFLAALFPTLVELLDRDDSSVSGTAPKLLLSIDRERALTILLSPKYFSIQNRECHDIIKALNEAEVPIPHEVLLPFLDAVTPLANSYPNDYSYAEALRAYARNPDGVTEARLRTEVASPNEEVASAAAESLAFVTGVTNARRAAYRALKRAGVAGLTPPQRQYLAVCNYDGEVRNGGHSQYFVNSSGDEWRMALAGLHSIGARERAAILQESLDQFGKDGPSEDALTRHRQVSRFSDKQDQTLDRLDQQYYAASENIDVLLSLYAIENRADFGDAE